MGSDIILCMALIASFAFVIQFLLSILGSDLDTDIDIDSASDFKYVFVGHHIIQGHNTFHPWI